MSLRVGLGASQADLDVQGEIDFDFFDESDCSSVKNKDQQCQLKSSEPSSDMNTSDLCSNSVSKLSEKEFFDENGFGYNNKCLKMSSDGRNFNKPLIRVSRDNGSGVVQKTIETVIPTPFTYKDNKCGRKNVESSKRAKSTSPRRKGKPVKEESDMSDDSSVSSMSGSDSISSVSADSFELDETDSMTDVSPIASPYCYTPTFEKTGISERFSRSIDLKDIKKDGVKFTDEVKEQECVKCSSIDFRELVSAMNRLQMKQDVSSLQLPKHSPVLTHKAKCRKNLSFSNEEVRKIDGDNQILLKKIIAQQNRAKTLPFSAIQMRSSSAVNRQKQQRQIDLENLALLKRLETTKPSHNLSRTHLLRDYDRRSSGLLSRSVSRSSYPGSCSQVSSYRTSSHTSGRSSSISIKSASNLTNRSSLSQTHIRSSSSK